MTVDTGDAERERAVEAALRQLGLEDRARLLAGQDMWSLPALPAIGLDSLVMSDGPIGVRGRRWSAEDPSVALPSPHRAGGRLGPGTGPQGGQAAGPGGAPQGRPRAAGADGEPAPQPPRRAGTSRRTARTRCSPGRSAPGTCAGCRTAASASPSSTSSATRPRPTASPSNNRIGPAHAARAVPRALRGDRRGARPWGVMAAYTR